MDIVDIIMRALHVGSAIVLAGGAAFMVLAMRPAMRLVDESFAQTLCRLVQQRFMRLAHAAIGLLAISGAWNWWRNVDVYGQVMEHNRAAGIVLQGLLGIKVMLALAVFTIIFALSVGALKSPQRWAKVNLTLAALIVILAAVVRFLRLTAG